jgi:hypothetical protein
MVDTLFVPSTPIYCTDYSFKNLSTAACFVRQGNVLLYPIITSYGWSDSGTGRPKQCTAKIVAKNPAAKYYCSKYCTLLILKHYQIHIF